MDLKLNLAGTSYTAPAPKAKHFKAYLKLLRDAERAKSSGNDEDIDMEVAFIASLFADPEVTADRLEEEADFGELARLHGEYLGWLSQYIPDKGKNAKAR